MSNPQPMDYAFEELIDPSLLQRLGDEVHQSLGVSEPIVDADNKLVTLSAWRLEELVDPSLLQRLVDEIHQTLGVSVSIVDAADHFVASSPWQDVCTMLHRAHPEVGLGCRESNQQVWEQVEKAMTPVLYRCPRGLVCAAMPIVVEGRHLANFMIGQIFLEPPDIECFRHQAREFGFDVDEYLEAVRKVPIFSEYLLRKHLPFVAFFAQMLAQIGLERIRAIEASKRTRQVEAMRSEMAERASLLVARSFERSMTAISKLVELRDPYTAGHQRQVRDWACAICARLGVGTADMIIGATLHDVGKIYVPVEVLTKPGALSPEEYELLKEHPWYGREIAKEIELSEAVITMIYQHHERLDGSGYPLGLRDGEINLEGRILAVADVVDSITSDRPYRPARSIDWAVDEIKTHRGVRYDAQVVDACLEVIRVYGGVTPPFEECGPFAQLPVGQPSAEAV